MEKISFLIVNLIFIINSLVKFLLKKFLVWISYFIEKKVIQL